MEPRWEETFENYLAGLRVDTVLPRDGETQKMVAQVPFHDKVPELTNFK